MGAEPPTEAGAGKDVPRGERNGMGLLPGGPSWLPRALLLAGVALGGFFVGWWLLDRLRGLLIVLVLAQFLAFALEPAVNWLADRGWRRGLATGFVMLVVTLVIGGFVVAVGSLVVSQVASLAEKAPSYAEDLLNWANRTFDVSLSSERIQRQLTADDGPLVSYSQRLAEDALGIGTTALGVVFQFFTVLLFGFYLCADGPRVRRAICSMLTPARQREVLRAWEIAIDKTGGYLYSRLLLGLVSGFAHYAVLLILDVPYAVALALWIGVVPQLVPTVGTYLAAALPVLVALVISPTDALILLAFIAVYQQIENYLLQPRITARTLDLHPAVAFGAVIAGASVLGAVGALLAIPFTAIVQTFVGTYIRRYEVEDHALVERDESAD
jgi:predicted PurR-regulated permease PerM